jgi:hypothetical protein
MSNEVAKRQPNFGDDDYDDGFNASTSQRTIRNFLRWTEQLHWVDRDGITPRRCWSAACANRYAGGGPSPMPTGRR